MAADSEPRTDMKCPEHVLEERPRLSLLLDARSQLELRDVCLRLFSSSTPAPSDSDQARKYATTALGRLRHALQTPSAALGQNVQAMADACHGALVLSSALCAAAESSVLNLRADVGLTLAAEVGRRPVDEASFLISALCLEGPPALRPALLPCIGLLVQGRGHLLSLHPSLLDSLRCGLSSSSRAQRMRALETIVAILTGAPGEHGTTAILRHVAPLQHELLGFLAAEVPPSMTAAALAATEVLIASGTLSPRLALSRFVAECLAGAPCNVMSAQRVLLQLIAVEPQSLPDCLLDGVRQSAELWACRGVGPGELLGPGEPFGILPANLCDIISEDIRCKCAAGLLMELVGLRGSENGKPYRNLSVLAALLFRLLIHFAVDRHSVIKLISDFGLNLCHVESDREPPLGTCVACLVLGALSESTCDAHAPGLRSSSLCNLAAALEELDADVALVPGRRAALLALSSGELCMAQSTLKVPAEDMACQPSTQAESEAELRQAQSFTGTLSGQVCQANPQAKSDPELRQAESSPRTLSQHVREASTQVESDPEIQQALAPLPSDTTAGASDDVQNPWFAEYDACCGMWRCTLCAQAGGRNPYAKGMVIKPGLVSARMRMHAKSVVHMQAEEKKRKAASTKYSAGPDEPAATASSKEDAVKRSRLCSQSETAQEVCKKLGEPLLKEATERHARLGGA
eukprot:TRINITY_DN90203_c0_g1_i1.p1 TRINITY_DN90203_c0_g1~~TRINITY_DN90203_c0_g1_i1.p1  ORF type:complete len:692 (-),score=111.51 TRINITY_DN90203_c0_g1_i1:416-2491(-)